MANELSTKHALAYPSTTTSKGGHQGVDHSLLAADAEHNENDDDISIGTIDELPQNYMNDVDDSFFENVCY